MFKKCFIFLSLILILSSLNANQLLHFYYKDYQEINRLVFVFDKSVLYNVKMDTDNRTIDIELSNCEKAKHLIPIIINHDNPLIESIYLTQNKRDLHIQIKTKMTYYGESFQNNIDRFKLVIDIYKQEEPATLESAQLYLNFYDTVSFLNRAKILRKRIEKNDFISSNNTNLLLDKNDPTLTQKSEIIKEPEKDVNAFDSEELFNYRMPNITTKSQNYLWIKNSYDILEELRSIMTLKLTQAQADLKTYNDSKKVDISFLENLSTQHNIVAAFPLTLNSLKVRCEDQIKTAPKNRNKDSIVSMEMLNKMLKSFPEYQKQVQSCLQDYQNILNQ